MNAPLDDREGFAAFLLRMRAIGFADKDLIAAVEATPRRDFVASRWHDSLWAEGMLPIECGEALEDLDMQMQALGTLDLADGQKVLEIGTGSGYSAALMARIVGRVLTVERYRTLADQARQRLEALSIGNVTVRHADGSKGMPAEGPFDRIIVWAAFDSHPRVFVEMLSTGGVMVAPIGPADGRQALARLTKVGSRFEREDFATARLQPLADTIAAAL